MTNVWPATLPQYVQAANFSAQRVDNKVRSKNEDGSAKTRRRFTKQATQYQIAVMMTTAQKAIFDDFYDVTLAGGSLPFDWVRPFEQDTTTFTFAEEPSDAAAGPDTVLVNMKIETVP